MAIFTLHYAVAMVLNLKKQIICDRYYGIRDRKVDPFLAAVGVNTIPIQKA